jgi:chromosome segregation ATPase
VIKNIDSERAALETRLGELRAQIVTLDAEEEELNAQRRGAVASELLGQRSRISPKAVTEQVNVLRQRRDDVRAAIQQGEQGLQDLNAAEDRVRFEAALAEYPTVVQELAARLAEFRELRPRVLELAGEINDLESRAGRMMEGLCHRARKLGLQARLDDLPVIPGVMWNHEDMRIENLNRVRGKK